jgi:hypothetical protein
VDSFSPVSELASITDLTSSVRDQGSIAAL